MYIQQKHEKMSDASSSHQSITIMVVGWFTPMLNALCSDRVVPKVLAGPARLSLARHGCNMPAPYSLNPSTYPSTLRYSVFQSCDQHNK